MEDEMHAPRTRITLAFLALATASAVAFAQQNPTPTLKMKDVTEAALVDALAIDPPESADGKTRSLRPSAKAGGDRTPSKAAGKSNLLITFATNSAELTSESKQALATVAKALQSDKLAGFSFSIEGHADPRGLSDANLKLSEARAKSVVSYLVSTHGILADRLDPIGKGSSELLNADKPDAVENRRVTIVTKRQ
jgi:OmpA-OmpF porin, OOP family